MGKGSLSRVAAAFAALLAAGLGNPAGAQQAALDTVLPEPSGPYGVGRMFQDWTDEARTDPFAPAPDTPRRLPVVIWYPTDGKGDGNTPYFPAPLREAFPADLSPVRTHAIDGAAPAQGEARFPVLLLKAALGFLAVQHSALAEDLASHGYIVVGTDSPYTTPLVVYQDGSTAERTDAGAGRDTTAAPDDLAPGQPNGAYLTPLRVWVADNRFVLDRLEVADTGDGPLAGRMDLTDVGAFGHSYGGAAALGFCRQDARCDAAVNIDGFVLGEVVRSGLDAPALFVFSDRPVFHPDAPQSQDPAAQALLAAIDRIRRSLPNRPSQAIIRGSGHFNFTDAALYLDPVPLRQAGAIGPIEPERAARIADDLLLAFFDAMLKHRTPPSDPVADVAASYPEIVAD